MKLHTEDYHVLEIYAVSCPGTRGNILLSGPGGQNLEIPEIRPRLFRVPVLPDTEYEISLISVQVLYAYLSGCEDLLERGVCFLEFSPEGAQKHSRSLGFPFALSPIREQSHFQAYKNWLNDPNGLCWKDGYYHMFYQMNPGAQKWDTMYWGHAASRDLVHWVYLPIALKPQTELLLSDAYTGGAYSGSAVPCGDGIAFFFTRDFHRKDLSEPILEYQARVTSRDMLHFSEEIPVLTEKPEGCGQDFRDPKVTFMDGCWQMVVGGMLKDQASYLHYVSADQLRWDYQGPLWQESEPGIEALECPDYFPLDGCRVLFGAWMHYADPNGRTQLLRYHISGSEGAFRPRYSGWLDFGSNFYAAQSFEHQGRRILIGWILDTYGEHRPEANGALGSMSFPRKLSIRNGRLCQTPAEEVFSLLGPSLKVWENVSGAEASGQITIPGNSYYLEIELEAPSDFDLTLAEEGENSLRLVCSGGKTALSSTAPQVRDIRFPSAAENVTHIQVFFDRRMAEVFLNHGEDAGTKLFYCSQTDGKLTASFPPSARLRSFRLARLLSIY